MGASRDGEVIEHLRALWARKWSVLAITAAVTAAALFYSSQQTKIYKSTAEVLVRPVNLDPTKPASAGEFINLEPERRLATSVVVAEEAAESLPGIDLGSVSVDAPELANTLIFTASSPQPLVAQRTAQAFAEAYLAVRLDAVLNDLQAASEPLNRRIDDLTDQIQQVQEDLADADTDSELRALEIELNSLLVERTNLQAKRNELILPQNLQVGTLLISASLPSNPSSPNHERTGSVAAFVGVVLGIAQALVRSRFDNRLRSRMVLAEHVRAPVLAAIPETRSLRSGPAVVSPDVPANAAAAEAYRTLRAAVRHALADQDVRSVVVSSPSPGDGKTTTTANLAVALAQGGMRVIVVSADVHRRQIEQCFPGSNGRGLVNVLENEDVLFKVLRPTAIAGLAILDGGESDNVAVDPLASSGMQRVVSRLEEHADLVLFDCPPVLATSEPLTLAAMVGGVLLVTDAQRTTSGEVEEARYRLDSSGAHVVGAVLNRWRPASQWVDGYYYGSSRPSSAAAAPWSG